MLPVTLEMRDHMRREKTGHLPKPLSERTLGVPTYAKGDLGYWRPGGNFVIFYLHDGLTIPTRYSPTGENRIWSRDIRYSW